jgi:hypothetical protein
VLAIARKFLKLLACRLRRSLNLLAKDEAGKDSRILRV